MGDKVCMHDGCEKLARPKRKECESCRHRRAKRAQLSGNVGNTKEFKVVQSMLAAKQPEDGLGLRKFLQKYEQHVHIKRHRDLGNSMANIVQGTELFVKYVKKPGQKHDGKSGQRDEDALYKIHEGLPNAVRNLLDVVASDMAEKHFNSTKKFPFVLHSAAVIVNHAPHHVHGGFPHMDGAEKEYQLFLNLGEEKNESTLVYKGEDVRIADALAFAGLKRNLKAEVGAVVKYRNFFQTRRAIVDNMKPCMDNGVAPGEYVCFDSSIIHAKPATTGLRINLFAVFTAAQSYSKGEHYEDSVQVHPWSVFPDRLLGPIVENATDTKNLMEVHWAHARVLVDWGVDLLARTCTSWLQDWKMAKKMVIDTLSIEVADEDDVEK